MVATCVVVVAAFMIWLITGLAGGLRGLPW